MRYYKEEATIIDFFIAFLFSCRSTSIRNSILWERVKKRREINKNTYYKNLSRLKEKGIVNIINKNITINKFKLNNFYKYKLINTKPNGTSKIILIFDVPEKERRTRNWLRNQIKLWGFTMIQKSVWLGPGPLPDEFQGKVKLLNLKNYIKIFKVENKSNIKSGHI